MLSFMLKAFEIRLFLMLSERSMYLVYKVDSLWPPKPATEDLWLIPRSIQGTNNIRKQV